MKAVGGRAGGYAFVSHLSSMEMEMLHVCIHFILHHLKAHYTITYNIVLFLFTLNKTSKPVVDLKKLCIKIEFSLVWYAQYSAHYFSQ